MNHDPTKHVGSTTNGLELFNDDFGLGFRFQVPDTALGDEARSLVDAQYGLPGMSVGFVDALADYREIRGELVSVLIAGKLEEISLVPTGANTAAYALPIDVEHCGSLREESISKKLLTDGAYVELMRATRKLMTTIAA